MVDPLQTRSPRSSGHLDFHELRFGLPQREQVAHHLDLHGVAEGSDAELVNRLAREVAQAILARLE